MNPERMKLEDMRRWQQFAPWWVRCRECEAMATLKPDWRSRTGQCICDRCGAIYQVPFKQLSESELVGTLRLWLTRSFRDHLLWAFNRDHLEYLERMLAMKLREAPVVVSPRGLLARRKSAMAMPFNLPEWMLSSKNREDVLHAIGKLKDSIPAGY